ncbi:MAG: hypothetical protein RLZZ557_1736 [Bacteroidota bacterium]|jgi:acyl-CoA thioesterase FadM
MRNRKIIPPEKICFMTTMDVQVGDINYGGHVGNERYLLFAQETRLRFLASIGQSEMHFGAYGLVLTESHVEYFHELFRGDKLTVALSITAPTRAGFDCYYAISTHRETGIVTAAVVKTSMVCFDYSARKVRSIPDDLSALLTKLSEEGNQEFQISQDASA